MFLQESLPSHWGTVGLCSFTHYTGYFKVDLGVGYRFFCNIPLESKGNPYSRGPVGKQHSE